MPKNKGDWLAQGLELLAKSGADALTIEALTVSMGLTKGSFYHHFENIGDYREKLVDAWAQGCLSTIPGVPKKESELLPALDAAVSEAFGQDADFDLAFRAWAQQEEMVRARVAHVDSVRQAYLSSLFASIVDDWERASLMADMLYGLLVGSSAVIPPLSGQRAKDIYEAFKRLNKLSEKEQVDLQSRLPI